MSARIEYETAAVGQARASGVRAPAGQLPATSSRMAGGPLPGRAVRLFGLGVCDTSRAAAAHWIVSQAVQGARTRIGFINAHCVNVMYRDDAYRTALQHCDRIFVDGSGMMLAARSAGIALTDNLNGTDLFPVLCRQAALAGQGIFLFGGREGVAREAGQRMLAEIPGLVVSGSHHGYVANGPDEDRLIDAINASKAAIVLVGLGVPAQELWIARNHTRLHAAVLIGVGGLFDYYSGRIPRAPTLLRRSGLEWVWRMAMEPRRLAGRYVLGNVEFLARLARLRLVMPGEFGREHPS